MSHPLIDGHNDVLLRLEREGSVRSFLDGTAEGHLDLPRARAGGFAGGFFACFVPADIAGDDDPFDSLTVTDEGWEVAYADPVDPGYARDVVLRLGGRLFELAAAGALRVVRSAADVQECLDGVTSPAIWHLEGAEAIDPGLEILRVLHAAGVRSLGPVWSRAQRLRPRGAVPLPVLAGPGAGPHRGGPPARAGVQRDANPASTCRTSTRPASGRSPSARRRRSWPRTAPRTR